MPELRLAGPPPRAELLRQLRLRLPDVVPGMRVLAQDLLGADAPIDFVGVDLDGRAVVVLVDEGGDEAALLGRALAQRAWVEPRLGDWLQLAPDLGLRPEQGTRLVLLAPGFSRVVEAAASSLGDAAPTLVAYRCVQNGAGVEALLERPAAAPASVPEVQPPQATPAPGLPAFRTGLTDADLGVSPDEQSEFQS